MDLITTTKELADVCARMAGHRFVTVDTEFLRETTYYPLLCVAQMATADEAVVIDALAEGIDLTPFFDLMAAESVVKVFHAARQDIEIFVNLTGKVPAPIFDTQVAAMVCGFGEAASYETLASKLGGATIDKSARFTDWAQRPLSERQLRYALADVGPLRIVYEKLAARLQKTGRASWLDEEMAALTDPELYRLDPATAWKRLKLRSNNRRMLALAYALASWRETAAQKRDLPRNRVLRDESLLEIAAHAPHTIEELGRARGLGKGFAESKFGGEILAVVERMLAMPESDYPKAEPRRDPPQGIGPLVDLLRVLLKLRAEENDVAARLIADAEDLELLAADDHADIRAVTGWRHEIFGRDALDLKHGRLALTAAGKRIKLVRSDTPATQPAS